MKSTHNLLFEVTDWYLDPHIKLFRVGTCEGQWFSSTMAYHILSIKNNSPGNGHLNDVFEWFENSCKRDKLPLMIMDFFNPQFKLHCITKRGFVEIPKTSHLIKVFH